MRTPASRLGTIAVVLVAVALPARAITVGEVIDRIAEAERASRTRHIVADCLTSSEVNDRKGGTSSVYMRTLTEYWTNGTNEQLETKLWRLPQPDAPLHLSDAYVSKLLLNSNIFYEFHAPKNASPNAAYLIRVKNADRKELFENGQPDAPMDGLGLGNDAPLSTVLRAAESVRIEPDAGGGNPAAPILITATASRFGRYKLRIDPQHGYNLCGAEVQKSGENLFDGVRMSEATKTGSRRMVSFILVLKQVNFQKVGNRWFPSDAEIERRVTEKDGTQGLARIRCRRTHVDFDGDVIDMAMKPSFPEGTRLFDSELTAGMQWKWSNGRAVPTMDAGSMQRAVDTTLERVERALPTPDNVQANAPDGVVSTIPWTRRFGAWAAGIAGGAVALLAGLAYIRRRAGHPASRHDPLTL